MSNEHDRVNAFVDRLLANKRIPRYNASPEELEAIRMAIRLRAARPGSELPDGAFYLWATAPDGDAWAAARDLARRAGIVVSPGEFYGPESTGFFRVAAVQPDGSARVVRGAASTRHVGHLGRSRRQVPDGER